MILLVTGGSASGKSEYAENRALQLAKTEQKKLIYLAAMKPFGEEAAKRIERHRQLRAGKGFETVERYTDIEGLCRDESLEAETFRQIVSINVFEEGMQQYDAWTRAYMQCLGELNQALTRKADTAVEVVYSIPVPCKEGLTCNL